MRTLLFSAVIALASFGCDQAKPKADHADVEQSLPVLSVDQVAAGLDTKQLTVVDCNMDSVRKDQGVIPGAILISDSDAYPATALPADKATKLVFYCGGPG